MYEVNGIWFPEAEQHIPKTMSGEDSLLFYGRGVFQFRKFAASFPHIYNFRHAVDIGANVGTWSRVFSRMFSHVSSFEPLPQHRDCFILNIDPADMGHVTLYAYALGEREGEVFLSTPKADCLGMSHIVGRDEKWQCRAQMRTLDSFDFTDVDYIKIDVEGYEYNVIRGAEETIRRCRPTMIIEQKPLGLSRFGNEDKAKASKLLGKWGYELVMDFGGDHILRFKK